MKIVIGADPEVFVKRGDQYVSAHGMIKGTKAEPEDAGVSGQIQVDGTALEINVTPAVAKDYFEMYTTDLLNTLKSRIPKDCTLSITQVADFDPEYFNSLPQEAKQLGCDPDFDAWTGTQNDGPDGKDPVRVAGGHIHVGWTDGKDVTDPSHIDDCRSVVRQLDYYIGLFTLIYDQDDRRRDMYGKAGAFRPKPYGVEYRTPSNAWLADEKLIRWIHTASIRAVVSLLDGWTITDEFNDYARRMINEGYRDWYKDTLGAKIYGLINNSYPYTDHLPKKKGKKKTVGLKPGSINLVGEVPNLTADNMWTTTATITRR